MKLSKWYGTIRISWTNTLAYRVNFFLEVLGPVIVFFFINYNLWSSIYQNDQSVVIKGYSLSDMLAYHSWSMVVALIATGHHSANLSEDIRLGRISSFLIYPFQFWEYQTANFLAFQMLQLFIASFFISVLSFTGLIEIPSLFQIIQTLIYASFVGLFWFLLQYLIGVLAFWLEETWILRVLLQIVAGFLAGAYFPIDLYPDWAQELLAYTPFPYLRYYIIQGFMGKATSFASAYSILLGWSVLIIFLLRFTWFRGIKRYSAAGM